MIKLKKATISTKSIWLGLPTDEQRIFFSNLSELGVTPEDIYQANRDPESLLKVGKKICGLESSSISIEEDSGEIKIGDLHSL